MSQPTSSSPNSSSSSDAPAANATPDFRGFRDVGCPVHVVLGSGHVTVRQCLELARQSVLRLEQSAGEDLSLEVNGVLVARGEVVIVEDNTALRLTEIAPASSSEGRS